MDKYVQFRIEDWCGMPYLCLVREYEIIRGLHEKDGIQSQSKSILSDDRRQP